MYFFWHFLSEKEKKNLSVNFSKIKVGTVALVNFCLFLLPEENNIHTVYFPSRFYSGIASHLQQLCAPSVGSAPQLENHWIKQFGANDIKHMKLDNLKLFVCLFTQKQLMCPSIVFLFFFCLLIQFRVGRGLESISVTAKKAGYTSDRSPVNHRARDRQPFMLIFPSRAK